MKIKSFYVAFKYSTFLWNVLLRRQNGLIVIRLYPRYQTKYQGCSYPYTKIKDVVSSILKAKNFKLEHLVAEFNEGKHIILVEPHPWIP